MIVFFEWKYHTSGFLGQETHKTAGRIARLAMAKIL
jgi:hypothetical protein